MGHQFLELNDTPGIASVFLRDSIKLDQYLNYEPVHYVSEFGLPNPACPYIGLGNSLTFQFDILVEFIELPKNILQIWLSYGKG